MPGSAEQKSTGKNDEREPIILKKNQNQNTLGYLWYYSGTSYIWGQLQLNITGCQSPAQMVTNRGKKMPIFWIFFLFLP